MTAPLVQRFWAAVDMSAGPDGCWIWTGAVTSTGYGSIGDQGTTLAAHRLSLKLAGRPVPTGSYACHRCDNPLCVNPAHLFVGSPSDNNQDMAAKGRHGMTARTHCPAGHAYDSANTEVRGGKRRCLACRRARRSTPEARARAVEANRAYRRAKKQEASA